MRKLLSRLFNSGTSSPHVCHQPKQVNDVPERVLQSLSSNSNDEDEKIISFIYERRNYENSMTIGNEYERIGKYDLASRAYHVAQISSSTSTEQEIAEEAQKKVVSLSRLLKSKEKMQMQVSRCQSNTKSNNPVLQLTQSALKGCVESQIELGDLHLKGNGVKQNDSEAFSWFKKAASTGNPVAQCKLGEMYQYGYGVQADDREAAKWYKLSADQKHANGQFRLGWLYERGYGIPKDVQKAKLLYIMAANQGHENAHTILSASYPDSFDEYTLVGEKPMTFDECFEKHFQMAATSMKAMMSIIGVQTIEESTLSILKKYDGSYELADEYLGALILHVKLGNISGYDINKLLYKLSWSPDFKADINKLVVPNQVKTLTTKENNKPQINQSPISRPKGFKGLSHAIIQSRSPEIKKVTIKSTITNPLPPSKKVASYPLTSIAEEFLQCLVNVDGAEKANNKVCNVSQYGNVNYRQEFYGMNSFWDDLISIDIICYTEPGNEILLKVYAIRNDEHTVYDRARRINFDSFDYNDYTYKALCTQAKLSKYVGVVLHEFMYALCKDYNKIAKHSFLCLAGKKYLLLEGDVTAMFKV